MVTPWVECDCCGDYLCQVHDGYHVHECDCPEIDVWAEFDALPYGECSDDIIAKVLASPRRQEPDS